MSKVLLSSINGDKLNSLMGENSDNITYKVVYTNSLSTATISEFESHEVSS
jgi:hypothetical protein